MIYEARDDIGDNALAYKINLGGIADKVRTIANPPSKDSADALDLKRQQCIVSLVGNAHLVMALCDCGKVDPRHDVRERIRSE